MVVMGLALYSRNSVGSTIEERLGQGETSGKETKKQSVDPLRTRFGRLT